MAQVNTFSLRKKENSLQSSNRFYEFSGADLRAAKHSLESQFGIKEKNNLPTVDWEQFRGLMMNAIYGGRIEVDLDNRVLLAFLKQLFNSAMIDGAGGEELAPGLKLPTFGRHLVCLQIKQQQMER